MTWPPAISPVHSMMLTPLSVLGQALSRATVEVKLDLTSVLACPAACLAVRLLQCYRTVHGSGCCLRLRTKQGWSRPS